MIDAHGLFVLSLITTSLCAVGAGASLVAWLAVRRDRSRPLSPVPPARAGYYWVARLDPEGYECIPHEVVHLVNTMNGRRVLLHGIDGLFNTACFNWGPEVVR